MDKALATQLANIEKRTGKSLAELSKIVKTSGLAKHGELRDMLMRDLGMGYGDANTLVHVALKSDGASAAVAAGMDTGDVLAEIYSGPKEGLRPIHDKLMVAINEFGPFEIAPKKGYGVEVGLNMKGVPGTARLAALPAGGTCQYKVKVTDAKEVDAELVGWIRQAYEAAGA